MKQARFAILCAITALTGATSTSYAAPIALSGFQVGIFAAGPIGTSGADSVEIVGNEVYVGYSNGTPKDGTAGNSTIVRYSSAGTVLASTTVAGHTDGLRYNPSTNQLWALQNEDANTNLVLVTPGTLKLSSPLPLPTLNGGGGFDDILFNGGKAYLSVSNPANSPNTNPALVSATLSGNILSFTNVLLGNATATVGNTSATTTLNLQDPDSLSLTKDGRIALTSQGDGNLILISNPGTSAQNTNVFALNTFVDDTVFGGSPEQTLLVADKTTNSIYRVTGAFSSGNGYSAAADANGANGFIGALDLTSGLETPIVTGLGNPAGEGFLPAQVPEPATIALFGLGLLGFAASRRKSPK